MPKAADPITFTIDTSSWGSFESFINKASNKYEDRKKMSPLIYDQEKKEYKMNPKMDCFQQLQEAIKIITPYLQTNAQIRNVRFLSIFNDMFLLLRKISIDKRISDEDRVLIGNLIYQVEKVILH